MSLEDYLEDQLEDYQEERIQDKEKEIRVDIDQVADAFMRYMTYATRENIPDHVADALWAMVEQGLPYRRQEDKNKPINIVVNAATRWMAERTWAED